MLRTVLLPFVRRCSHARALSTAVERSCTGEGKEKLVIFDTTLRDGGGCFSAQSSIGLINFLLCGAVCWCAARYKIIFIYK